ncbi:MAG: acyloxyacyl hydrolase [Bryobacteraceae bacterium]|jgi:Lipid A 3-O-deacylase (PagL)
MTSCLKFYAALLLLAAPAGAGICSADGEPRHEFQFMAGYSPVSTTLIGTTTDRRFVMAGFGYSYRCWVWSGASISYTGEILPAAILLQPGQYLPQYVAPHAVYGFGITPLGFTAEFARGHRVYPFLQTNEGIIASSEPIPINVIGATGLNFMIDLGGGVRIRTSRRRAISLGYKYLHVSNGFTSPVNPGVDNNVFYAGFSLLR